MDVVGVMAAYFPMMRVCTALSREARRVCTTQSREALCVLHCLESHSLDSAVHTVQSTVSL